MIDYNLKKTFVTNRNIRLIIIQDKFRLPETIERSLLERMEGAALKHQMLRF